MRRKGAIKKLFLKHKCLNATMSKPGLFDFVLVLDGLKPDFNIGKIFRTADAFGCREIHLINVPYFNPAMSRGSFKHIPAKFHTTFSSVYGDLSQAGYKFFVLEPGQHQTLTTVEFPQKSAFVFGHEEYGISFKKEDYLGVEGLTVPQFGRVQSLNVSIAASVVMYEYVRQSDRSNSTRPSVCPQPQV